VILNLLGDLWANGQPRWDEVLRHRGTKLHLYGKNEARPGRKMGHVTVLAQQSEQGQQNEPAQQIELALAEARQIKSILVAGAAAPAQAHPA
jgi:5-(carboxyamino)imidazole ribonucleotide synthase